MIALALLLSQTYVHEPFANYSKEVHAGFTVYISAAARKNNDTTQPAIDLLAKQLKGMTEVMPAESLKTLRKVPVFIEQENPGFPCACYHPNKDWLKQHGYIPEKLQAVEISNTKNYVNWIHLNQPFMTLSRVRPRLSRPALHPRRQVHRIGLSECRLQRQIRHGRP